MLNVKKAKGGKCTISLEGDLDIYSAAAFKQKLMPNLEECTSFVFDLSAVGEIDTSCFQVLVQAKRECEKSGKEMQMVSHSPAMLEILDLYDMESFFGDPLLMPSEGDNNVTSQNKA